MADQFVSENRLQRSSDYSQGQTSTVSLGASVAEKDDTCVQGKCQTVDTVYGQTSTASLGSELILPTKGSSSLIPDSVKDNQKGETRLQVPLPESGMAVQQETQHGNTEIVVSSRPSLRALTPFWPPTSRQWSQKIPLYDIRRACMILIDSQPEDDDSHPEDGDGGKKPVLNPVETYTRNPLWPHSHIQRLRPEAMVKAGFIFTGKEDIVKCLTCNLQVGQWLERTALEPFVVHCRERPICPFVQGQTSGSHMPLMSMPVPMMTNAYYSNLYEKAMPSYGAQGSGKLDFSKYVARLNSFREYDTSMPMSKYALADAGFFLVKSPDFTECFACGMVLKDWEIGDEPMKEHRSLAPHCSYVQVVGTAEAVDQQASSQPLQASVGYDATQFDSRPTSLEISFSSMSVEARPVPKVLSSREAHMETYRPPAPTVGNLTAKLDPPPTTHGAHSGRYGADYRQRHYSHWGGETGPAPPILYPPASRELRRGDVLAQLPVSTFGAASLLTPQYTSAPSSAEMQSELKVCRICMDKEIDAIFLPCGHVCCCSPCAKLVTVCPICRHQVEKISHAYLPF